MSALYPDLCVLHKLVPQCSGLRFFLLLSRMCRFGLSGIYIARTKPNWIFVASTYNQTDGRKERLHYPYLDLEEPKLLYIQQK